MEIYATFYIGIADFVAGEASVSNVVRAEMDMVEKVRQAIESGEFTSTLSGTKILLEGSDATTDTAVADDQDGLPILMYVTVTFEIPESLEIVFEVLDEDDLSRHLSVELNVGNFSFTYCTLELG